ncbi:solute carrier family 25 member 46-like, partial [Asbolus verrucosus]
MDMASHNNLDLDLDLDSDDELSHLKASKRQITHEELLRNREIMAGFPNRYYETQEDVILKRRIGSGVAFVSLVAENLLSHPFQVLRRQCQVHHTSQRYHLLPFTLVPTVYRLHQHQGLTTLWKGLGSVLLVRGISLGVEDLISKITPWPNVSLAIVTPFYSASFVETVQSEIASEKPGILDVFKEGFMRLLNWNGGAKGRMLPIWVLIVPTITLGLSRYLFTMMVKGASVRLLHSRFKNRHEANGALPKDISHSVVLQDLDITASLIANIASDVAFFPCETIIHRLYLQGTRTIVDNLDSGRSVLPILTNFAGAMDCYESCLASEGTLGLYKGFGALIMQYTIHIALIQFSRFLLTELGSFIHKPKKQPPLPTDISPAALSNLSATHRSYLLP